jgi:hypothetical protein
MILRWCRFDLIGVEPGQFCRQWSEQSSGLIEEDIHGIEESAGH